MTQHPRVSYILMMYKAMEFSFSAAFQMLQFYMSEQDAFNELVKAKREMLGK